jgi:hypothetical protein
MGAARRRRPPIAAAGLACALGAAVCARDCPPLPDEFDGAFAKGTVCMPTNAHTSAGAATPAPFPLRFDHCLYRCASIVPGTQSATYMWQCAGPQCEMIVLATARLARVKSEKDCSSCELEDPPSGACTPRKDVFNVEPPHQVDPATGAKTYIAKTFTVRIPYLTIEQAGVVQRELKAGRDFASAIAAAGGGGQHAGRSFTVTFDPKNAPARDALALTGADCHKIDVP